MPGRVFAVSAMPPSRGTATGNHPGPWEIPELICATSTLIVTGMSAVLQEEGLAANLLCGIRRPALQACHRQDHRRIKYEASQCGMPHISLIVFLRNNPSLTA